MYAQIKSLLLMAVVLAAIIAYAFSPKELTLGSYTIRKITLTSIFLPPKEPQKKHKKKPKTIHRNQTILFIGDSMVEGLSRRLGDYAGENGHKLYTVIWYSSSTERWGTTHTLEHYIAKYKPTYILICLGSNELFINDLANRAQYVSEMVKKIGDIPFVWISPSDWNGDTGINDIIKERVGAGHFFDSRHLKLKIRTGRCVRCHSWLVSSFSLLFTFPLDTIVSSGQRFMSFVLASSSLSKRMVL